MKVRILHQLTAFILFSASVSLLPAQEVILGDEGLPVKWKSSAAMEREVPTGPAHKVTALSLPFVDDFSGSFSIPSPLFPDTANWLYAAEHHEPLISDAKGLLAPTKGVATFEGTTSLGVKYDGDDAVSGLADSLTSQAIDLSLLSPADSVYLSFFLEPGGAGDKPEATDSFVVYFDTTGNFDYARAWSVKGNELPSTQFTQVMVPLLLPVYFHGNFHFRFVGYGSLNGENDQWHLDYVRMNSGRNMNDTLINDVSVTGFYAPILDPYTAVPLDQWGSLPHMTAFDTEVSNLKGSAHSCDVAVTITDDTGNNIFSGTTIVTATGLSIPAVSHDTASLGAFGDQALTKVARINAEVTVTFGGDISSNDFLNRHYSVDSVLAMDDGVADAGYGLTVARGFCQEFTLPSVDTLTGVMIRFTPAIYVSPIGQVFDLDNKSFRLTIWKELNPDSILTTVSGGMNVHYGDSLNEFYYYPLLANQRVQNKIWIGIEQVDGQPIGVGLDRNFDNHDKIYWVDGSGNFVNTTSHGTLMIRPVFSNYVFVGTEEGRKPAATRLRVSPNPVTGETFRIRVEGDWAGMGSRATLSDMTGREVWAAELPPGSVWDMKKPEGLAGGMYFLLLEAEGKTLTTKIQW